MKMCLIAQSFIFRFSYFYLFTLSIESRCSLIKKQDPRIAHQSSGNSYPLLLTTRQLSSLAPHLGVVTRW